MIQQQCLRIQWWYKQRPAVALQHTTIQSSNHSTFSIRCKWPCLRQLCTYSVLHMPISSMMRTTMLLIYIPTATILSQAATGRHHMLMHSQRRPALNAQAAAQPGSIIDLQSHLEVTQVTSPESSRSSDCSTADDSLQHYRDQPD
jgi:hypothetical protein